MLNAEFIEKIADLAQEAHTNRVIALPNDPFRVIVVDDDGGHTFVPTRTKINDSAADFVTIAELYASFNKVDSDYYPEIWYTQSRVVLLHCLWIDDHEDRNDRTTLDMPLSSPFRQLQQWGKSQYVELKQVDLYMQIRTTFHNCLPDTPNLKELIGRVDFKKAQEASGIVKSGGVSMSRHLIAEASGADKLPDILTFRVPYWAGPLIPLMVNIRVAFDLNPQTEMYRLSILPGEIETADAEAAAAVYANVASALGSLGIPTDSETETEDAEKARVYHGSPS